MPIITFDGKPCAQVIIMHTPSGNIILDTDTLENDHKIEFTTGENMITAKRYQLDGEGVPQLVIEYRAFNSGNILAITTKY